ncbi:hypothetical protein DFH09DRAFT_1081086 [Mycena vulgaris]|nr:hypothetical protein DFH09DRAFT_1081086 [Mycena vulgaris]
MTAGIKEFTGGGKRQGTWRSHPTVRQNNGDFALLEQCKQKKGDLQLHWGVDHQQWRYAKPSINKSINQSLLFMADSDKELMLGLLDEDPMPGLLDEDAMDSGTEPQEQIPHTMVPEGTSLEALHLSSLVDQLQQLIRSHMEFVVASFPRILQWDAQSVKTP